MSFSRYPAYKDSGVEWLGEVPTHWTLQPAKRLVRTIDQGWSPQCEAVPAQGVGELGVLTVGCVNGGTFRPAENKLLPPELRPEPGLDIRRGDLLVSRANTRELVGGASAVREDFPWLLLCDKLYRLRLKEELAIPVFVAYYLGSASARSRIELDANGASASMVNIGQGTVMDLLVPTPPISEQTAVAAFLDRETARIGALVGEQERLIELLTEKRHAVISHAVTRGLDPNAAMKDSGVEGLGKVPAHWSVKRLKQVSPELTVGIVVEPSKLYAVEGIPALRSLNIESGSITLDNLIFITADGHERHSKSRLRAGDLVAVRTGQPGTTAVIPVELDGCNCIDLIIIRKPLVGSEKFLCWYLASEAAVHQFSVGSGGAIQQHFNVGTASDLVVPVPPAGEQIAIASFLDVQAAAFDALIAEAQRAISLLQERRAALITAAVTGQIDVRGLT